jgi:putative flippase GtrA
MLKKQFVGYISISTLNFILTSILFYILFKIKHINYQISLTIVWVCSILITYFLNLIFVFKVQNELTFNKFMKYVLLYFISYSFNIISLKYITETTFLDPYYTQFFLIPFIILINFFGIKYYVVNKNNYDKRKQD